MAQDVQNPEINPEQNPAFNIELPEDVANGVYSNLAVVMPSQSEFVLDFVSLLPGKQSAKVRSRVIMTPANLKRLVRVLHQNVQAYEQEVGAIVLPEDALPQNGEFGQGQA